LIDAPEARFALSMEAVCNGGVALPTAQQAREFLKLRNRPGLNGECHSCGAKSMSGLETPFAHPLGTVPTDGKALPADLRPMEEATFEPKWLSE
jgi:hypothetical protein